MTTARDMIKASLRNISVLGAGSSLSNEEAQDALDMLNGILSMWSAEGGLIYQKTTETFSLTTATSYTIGTGGDFNTTRPMDITYITVNDGTIDDPLYPMSQEQYAAISLKTNGSTPDSFYYDGNYPLGKIYFYPNPVGSETVTIYSLKPLTQFTNLTSTFDLPPENRLALEFALSEAIAPQYEREASVTVKKMAKQYKNIVMAQNGRTVKNLSEVDSPSRYGNDNNIYQGYE